MTTSVLFSVLMVIFSIQSSGCISIDESDFDEFFYSYQTTISDDNSFEFSREFDYEISEIAFESDDFILNEFSISSNILSLYLVCNTNSLMHFKLDVSFTNCRTQNEIYCAYQTHNMIFISSQSDEMAWQQMASYFYEKGYYLIDELEQMYDEFLEGFVMTEMVPISSYSISHDGGSYGSAPCTYVSGKLIYYETVDEDGNPNEAFPLKNIEVKLYVDGSNSLDGTKLKTTTNGDGDFIFYLTKYEYPSLYNSTYHDYYIKFYTEGLTYKVVNGMDIKYSLKSSKIESGENNSEISINCSIQKSETSDTIKAFSIACGLGYGEEFILNYSKFPSDYNTITYVFPSAFGNTWTYKKIGAFGSDDAYSIGSALHEYGHYVEQSMGAFGRGPFKSIGSSHHISDDLLLEYGESKGKEYVMMMAWDESLASIYSMIVCHHYDELFADDCDFTESAMTKIDNANNYEYINEDSGESQERAIIAYLWNLFDGNDKYDSISFTEKEFLDLTFVDGMYTLQAFIENLEDTYPSLMFESGSILERCAIAPSITSLSYSATSQSFSISFIPNGSQSNPNNYFNVLFYDENSTLIDGIYGIEPEIESNRGEISYSTLNMPVGILPFKIRNNASVYVSIEGYLNTDPISGPYRSSLVQLNTSSIGSIVRGDLIPIVSIIGG